MGTFGHISGAEPSTITFKVATITQTRNSSAMHQEVVSLGDPESSLGIAAILGAAPASTTFGLVVRRVGDSTSIIKGDSTVFQGGTWTIRANLSSTSGDNPVAISGNSTVAPLAGSLWTIQGNSTVAPLAGSTWNTRPLQSSAADLQMTATPAAGSTWNVRALQSSAADLNASVQPIAGSTWRTQPGSTLWASSAGFHFDSSGGLLIGGSITASGSTGPLTISQLLDSSGGSVTAADSANNAFRVNIVAGTVGFNLGTLQSSAVASAQSSALLVRIVGGPSSAVDCTIRSLLSSTSADNPVLATIGTNLQSSAAPSSNSSGLIVRTVVDNILTVASTNAFASTSLSIQSSAAGLRSYVTAYSILSTSAGPSKVKFYSGSTMLWPMIFAAISSAVSGANLAVSPPGYIFRTKSAGPLTLQLGGGASTIVGWQVAVSYFRAP
jgi:hypothetical protein